MSLGAELDLERAELEYKEALFEEVINEAAKLVILGHSRESAYQMAKDLINDQQEALSKGEYSELGDTIIPKGKEAQVKAIAEELRQQFEGDSV